MIVGSDGPQASEEILVRMISALRHRGPDESGIYLGPRVGLGNLRLSIIGLDDGTQPIANEDGTLWIVYNGEVFNYVELREDLIQRGHRFTTSTDTEVVLHLFEEHGPEGIQLLNGQFAFAIWDLRKEELFLARDRFGIRPLHFFSDGRQFIFASEIKALFQHPGVPREIDPQALDQVFTFWSTLSGRTVFKGIRELPPGHYMKARADRLVATRYWTQPHYHPDTAWAGSPESAGEQLESLVLDAVRLRLRADVPVGAYLSGGLDSSIITALISSRFNNRLRTFSIGFREDRFDESAYQEKTQRFLATDHTKTEVQNAEIRRHLPDVIWHCETPLLRTAPVPLYLLSRTVRDSRFKVVLTGEGADEVFAGYNIFKESKVRRFMARRAGSRLRPLLLQRLYPYVFRNASPGSAYLEKFFAAGPGDLGDPVFSHRIRWRNSARNRTFYSNTLLAELPHQDPVDQLIAELTDDFTGWEPLAQAQFLEIDVFLSNYLLSSQGDRVAMAHSVETRMPFLDYRVIDFASRLPAHWKLKGLTEKYILKKAFSGLLPEAVLQRPKQPYRAPIREAFGGNAAGDYVDDLLSEDSLRSAGYFNPVKTAGLARKFKIGTAVAPGEVQDMAFLGILTTQLVHHQFIAGLSRREIPRILPDKRVTLIPGEGFNHKTELPGTPKRIG